MKYDFEEKCRGGWVRATSARAAVAPFFIVIFNVLELMGRPFRPVWDG